jgi:SAM-dependent methyltransferase
LAIDRIAMPDRCPNPACRVPDIVTLLTCRKPAPQATAPTIAEFRLAFCRTCRLGFVDPQPSAELLAAFYPPDYAYWRAPPASLLRAVRLKHTLARWRQLRYLSAAPLARLKSRIAALAEAAIGRDASFSLGIPLGLPRHARILDYGFGAGAFLLALRDAGFTQLWGYDVDRNRRNLGRLRAAGIQAYCGIDCAQLPDGYFDCIRLEHVLEHLPLPVETLSALAEKLQPGGLMVLTVPSIHAWEPVERLADSPHLDHLQLPIHLWHHSTRSLEGFISGAGLDVVDVRRLRPFLYLSALARKPAQ